MDVSSFSNDLEEKRTARTYLLDENVINFSPSFFFLSRPHRRAYLYRALPTPRHKSPRLFFIDIPDITGHVPLNRNQIAIAARTLFLSQDNASRRTFAPENSRIANVHARPKPLSARTCRENVHACTCVVAQGVSRWRSAPRLRYRYQCPGVSCPGWITRI